MSEKPRTTIVADTVEVAALQAAGKYREGVPLWRKQGDTLLLLVGEIEVLKTWREKRSQSAKGVEP